MHVNFKGNTGLDRVGGFWTNRVEPTCFWTNRGLGKFVLFGPFYKMKSKPVLPLIVKLNPINKIKLIWDDSLQLAGFYRWLKIDSFGQF